MGCGVPPEVAPDGPAPPAPGGEVRWASDLAGRRVRLRWFQATDERVRDRLLDVIGTLAAYRHPGLAEPVLALLVDDGVIIAEAVAADLAGGRLAAGDVPGLAVRLADAVSAMNRRGVAMGRVDPADLVRTDSGEWQLSGFGLAPVAQGRRADARGDGAELARLLLGLTCLPGPVAAELTRVSLRQPSPADVAAVFAPPAVERGVRRPITARPVRRRRRRARARWRTPVAVGGTALALVGGAGVAGRVGLGLAAAHPAAAGWAAVVSALDLARSSSLAHPSSAALAAVEVPGSPAWSRDSSTLRALAAAGEHAAGLADRVISAEPVGGCCGSVELDVVESLSGYRLVTARGRVVAVEPGHGPVSYVFRLRLTRSGWRVYSVSAGGG
jgi:hypothetical protein